MLNGCFVNPSSATKLVGGVQVKATQGRDWLVFSGKPLFAVLTLSLSDSLPFWLSIPSSPTPTAPPPPISLLSPPLSFPLRSGPRVTAVGRCVRVEPALCGPSVWSPSAKRLLTGWMGESTTVYFTFFRMPGLCPEFLLSTSSFDPSQLGCSLRLRCLPV